MSEYTIYLMFLYFFMFLGVAAFQIGGTTLHTFAGIGHGTAPTAKCVELAARKTVSAQWRKCKHLIIDEISMIDGNYFKKLEAVARAIKGSDKPFGGIQLILTGDFLQLPPVTKGDEERRFAFETSAWQRCVQVNTFNSYFIQRAGRFILKMK